MNFKDRKAERKAFFEENVKFWKMVTCTACSGSGYYDHEGSPDCGRCEGTGKIREKSKND